MKTIVFAMAIMAIASVTEAQGRIVDYWQTAEECLAATSAPFYRPTIKRPRTPRPNEVVRGHPTGGCAELDVPDRDTKAIGRSDGYAFVRVAQNEDWVFDRNTGQELRMADCDNPNKRFVRFPPVRGERGLEGERGEVGSRGRDGIDGRQGERGEPGLQGQPGRDGRDGIDGKVVTQQNTSVEDGPSNIGITGSVSWFTTAPISGLVGGITGRDVCEVTGINFDIGLSFQKEEWSQNFGRLTFFGTAISDRSFTQYQCPDCPLTFTQVSEKARIWGVHAEWVFQFTEKRVKPMLSFYLNAGKVTGFARQYKGPIGGRTTSVETVEASELFGNGWQARGGVMAGISGDIGGNAVLAGGVAADNMGVGPRVMVKVRPF